MAISLYDLTVPSFQQTIGAIAGVLDKGAAHCAATGSDANALVGERLAGDMLPFAFQVWSVEHHSVGAINGCKAGQFAPPRAMPEMSYADLQEVVADAQAALGKLTPDEVNALEGKDVLFAIGDFKMPFTAENFLMSFSMPNFYFHATTTYDILRSRGVKLGKRDFMGKMRLKA
jgi:hypothetical protein